MDNSNSNSNSYSLWQHYPKRVEVPLLLMFNLVMLATAYWLPFMVMEKFFFFHDNYGIIHSLLQMWNGGYKGIAALIFAFSIVFPFAKLLTLITVWFTPVSKEARQKLLMLLEILGKWSMLDVFVAAVLIVLIEGQAFINIKPQSGLYVFAAAVLMSMVLTFLISKMAAKVDGGNEDEYQ